MSHHRVVADESFLDLVRAATGPVEVCDAAGRLVTVSLPPDLFHDLMKGWATSHYSREEAEEAWAAYKRDGGRSTAEVLERLKALDANDRSPA
jgi:hypothetical protein